MDTAQQQPREIIDLRNPFAYDNGIPYRLLDTGFPCLMSKNEYVPFHACHNAEILSLNNRRSMLYKLEAVEAGQAAPTSRVSEFCSNLFCNERLIWLWLRNANFPDRYFCTNGILFFYEQNGTTKPIPLVILAIKKGFLFEFDRNNIDYSKLCLVIDRNFVDNDFHNRLYRNIKRDYIDIVEKKMDVVYTTNIIRACYNTGQVAPIARTITELREQCNELNGVVNRYLSAQT